MKLFSSVICMLLLVGCQLTPVVEKTILFNGKDLTNWKISNFGGEGEVTIEDKCIRFEYGMPISGITWTGEKIPVLNYEISLEAMRLGGNDFFVGLTFPYKETHLSLILGGWGGFTCGISSFDHIDASENETSFTEIFEKKRWYKILLKVQDDHIVAFLDGKKVIDTKIKGRKAHIRPEVEPSKPLGLSSFETQALYRNLTLRKL